MTGPEQQAENGQHMEEQTVFQAAATHSTEKVPVYQGGSVPKFVPKDVFEKTRVEPMECC